MKLLLGLNFGTFTQTTAHVCIRSVHEKIRIPCELCESTFTHRNSLKLHIASVHEGKKPHQCSICDYKSAVKASLRMHIEQVHEKKNRKACALCNNTFSTIFNLRAHIASIHDGKKPTKKSQIK